MYSYFEAILWFCTALHGVLVRFANFVFSAKLDCKYEKFTFGAKNGLNFNPRHRKAQKIILSARYGDPYGREGDLCHVQDSLR